MKPLSVPELGQTAKGIVAGEAGPIECALTLPKEPPMGVAVVCHPHPLFGGAMSNKVVYTLDACAHRFGLASLKFNFRGVGASGGEHDQARGETDDCLHLSQWMAEAFGALPLLLAGFSFGGFVALRAANRLCPAALITVAPPLRGYMEGMDQPPRPDCPWRIIHSRDDDVVSFEECRQASGLYQPPPDWHVVDDAGHFFHGKLDLVRTATNDFLQQHWPTMG